MDTEEENLPEKIYQEEIPQPVRRYTLYVGQVHRLEPTMRGKIYQINHFINQTVEENEQQKRLHF